MYVSRLTKNFAITIPMIAVVFACCSLVQPRRAFAASTVSLGAADSFAVLAGSGITNSTGPTTITGDVGSSTTSTETGFGTVTFISGTNHADPDPNDAATQSAKTALASAYTDAAGRSQDFPITADLGTMGTLTPGVYRSASSIGLTGTVTLDGGGDPNAVFIFQAPASTLTTAASSHVTLTNSAQACNVFWQVGSSATLGTGSDFKGNILALTSITDTGGSTVAGRLLASNAHVTMSNTTIAKATCAPVLHLRKTVTLDNGGSALNTAWTLTATGTGGSPTNLSGTTPVDSGATFAADTYTLAETGGPSGYTASTYSCVKNGGGAVISNTIALVAGDTATCTINNNDTAAHLVVIKHVITDNGGSAVAGDFTTTISGVTTATATASGAESPGVNNTLTSVGSYSVDEGAHVGYSKVLSADCSGTIALGETKTCTITNDDIDPGVATLTLTKTVINTGGGTKVVADFPLFIDGSSATSGTVYTATAGLHTVSETLDVSYTSAISGDCAADGTVTLVLGVGKTCTITNTYIPATTETITVIKLVVGGSKVVADFPLFVDGSPITSGDTNSFNAPSAYTVTETSSANYTTTFSGFCPGGVVNLILGSPTVCTVTNTYTAPASGGGGGGYTPPVPPLIDVLKVPSPLALPNGSGTVKYTYTLRNIGTVPVNNVTMVGDTCSPITLISGDTNADARLDVFETWVYTCSTTLSKTHTNIVTATGWANGISAADIASATVVVGLPVVPPLIHVTKLPSPLILPAQGGIVTYTNKVTNPGTVALSNVLLTDDKCGPVNYISGDTDSNSKLDTTETWVYICQTKLTTTTVNTITASGDANGLTARDFAIATVVVAATPALPGTGFAPHDNSMPRNMVILTGVFAVLLLVCVGIQKNRAG